MNTGVDVTPNRFGLTGNRSNGSRVCPVESGGGDGVDIGWRWTVAFRARMLDGSQVPSSKGSYSSRVLPCYQTTNATTPDANRIDSLLASARPGSN